ncbi:MAG: RHS repeat-associated core domain-containing protein [Desulfosalsimonadaceae bacterium]
MGTDPDNITQPVEPEKRIYEYDPIGNRNTAIEGSASKSYTANSLNQYDEITAGGETSTLTYDADGNLTVIPANAGIQASGGQMALSYNAENRLINVEPQTPAGGDHKLEFIYDYMGRRVKKSVYAYNSDSWLLTSEFFFTYDGWNLVEEITEVGAAQTSRYFVWGQDLSQSLQGAGGVGGLIATVEGSADYLYCFDANGNVGQVVNVADGAIAAKYEYDPFGKPVKADGAYAGENPFRFSTKYHDDENGLVYYGYRYYSAEMGRWFSRDPIGEEGGINLHIFVNNDSLNKTDALGDKIYVVRRPLTIATKGWTEYFEGIGFLVGGLPGLYLGEVADYYRNNTWHRSLIVTCLGKNQELDLNNISPYDTWDFQSDSRIYHPAQDWASGFQDRYYKGRMAIDTIYDNDTNDAILKEYLTWEHRNQNYILGGSNRYNCCLKFPGFQRWPANCGHGQIFNKNSQLNKIFETYNYLI